MKKRMFSFLVLCAILGCIVLGSLVYDRTQEYQASTWENKALIAQSQAANTLAQSQANVTNAAAFAVYVNSFLVAFFSVLPYLMFITYLVYRGVLEYAKFQGKTNV